MYSVYIDRYAIDTALGLSLFDVRRETIQLYSLYPTLRTYIRVSGVFRATVDAKIIPLAGMPRINYYY